MKKISIVILLISNISCTSLIHYQEQPVEVVDQKSNIYKTTCSGMAESIGTCHQKAKRTCERGYQVLNEKLDSSGVHREVKFQCN